jgi:hypothetical protein
MAVQLVDDLGIAPLGITDQTVIGPKAPLPYSSGNRIAMPVNLGAELNRLVAEKRDLAPAEPVSLSDRPVDPLREMFMDEWPKVFAMAAIEATAWRPDQVPFEGRRDRRRQLGATDAGADPIQFRVHLLPDPVRQFARPHGDQPLELPRDLVCDQFGHKSPSQPFTCL